MSEASTVQVTLNFDAISDAVALGARRAAAFMSLGMRPANDETIRSFSLGGNHAYSFMSDPVSEQLAAEVRRNFLTWIVGNGLRELDQYFSQALDQTYRILTLLDEGPVMKVTDLEGKAARFANKTNAADKLATLTELFGIRSTLLAHMRSLSSARNALTHNAGFVTERHTFGQAALTVRWRGMNIHVGDRIITGPFEPIPANDGDGIQVSAGDREKTFPIGAEIAFTPHELHEICFTYTIQADEVKTSAIEFARAKGVDVKITK
jgi:hypothetical protein